MQQTCNYVSPCFHQLFPSPFMFVAEQSIINNHISPPAIEGRDVTCEVMHLVTADQNVPCECWIHLLSIFTALILTALTFIALILTH
jgi:hypothetical protein